MLAIDIEKVNKKYPNGVRALDDLSMRVNEGEIFALLGPNGAGKSTLINILTTYFTPTSGKVIMLGNNLESDAAVIRTQIACVAQRISIDLHLSLEENMMFQARLYKVNVATAKERMKELINFFGMDPYLKYPVISYSGGVKRRLDIAMNLISRPKILFLDEPTVGMNLQSRIAMWDMIKKIRNDFGTTVFLTTHYLEEADQLSDTICIMKDGHEMVQAAPAGLRRYFCEDMLRISLGDAEQGQQCADRLKKVVFVKSVELRDNSIVVRTEDSRKNFRIVNQWLLEQDIDFVGMEMIQPSLEDVFINLTNAGGKEQVQ